MTEMDSAPNSESDSSKFLFTTFLFSAIFKEIDLILVSVVQHSNCSLVIAIWPTVRKLLIVFNFHVVVASRYSKKFYDVLRSHFSHIRCLSQKVFLNYSETIRIT